VVAQWQRLPVRCERVGQPTVAVPAGHCLLIAAGVPHCVTVVGEGAARCRWAHVQITSLGAHDVFALLDLPLLAPPPAADGLGDTCAALVGLPRPCADLSIGVLARRKELHARLTGQLAALAPAGGRAWDEALRRTSRQTYRHRRQARRVDRRAADPRRSGPAHRRHHQLAARPPPRHRPGRLRRRRLVRGSRGRRS
jgi:hypothetical protein